MPGDSADGNDSLRVTADASLTHCYDSKFPGSKIVSEMPRAMSRAADMIRIGTTPRRIFDAAVERSAWRPNLFGVEP
jgi:hypothetical protein